MESSIECKELSIDMVDVQLVDDINALLPQLSSSGRETTIADMFAMIIRGTRVFVALDEAYQRQGIAKRLMMALAEEVSLQEGAKSINLTSQPDKGGARQMYPKLGYELRKTGVFRRVL